MMEPTFSDDVNVGDGTHPRTWTALVLVCTVRLSYQECLLIYQHQILLQMFTNIPTSISEMFTIIQAWNITWIVPTSILLTNQP